MKELIPGNSFCSLLVLHLIHEYDVGILKCRIVEVVDKTQQKSKHIQVVGPIY